jgi:hypothetical protein
MKLDTVNLKRNGDSLQIPGTDAHYFGRMGQSVWVTLLEFMARERLRGLD